MYKEYSIDIQAMIDYAKKWAYLRNPEYYNFEEIGGDCTNFVSQCLYAGGAVMNYTANTGWYYVNVNDRAPAWTSAEFFYRFMTSNKSTGPFGMTVPIENARVGDIIQLGDSEKFYHSMLVVAIMNDDILIAAHSNDAYDRPLSSYDYKDVRCIRILGVRKNQF